MASSLKRALAVLAVVGFFAAGVFAMIGIPPFEVVDVGPDDSIHNPEGRNQTSGGRVNGVAIDPGNDNIVYAASEWGGLFKSINGADSWFQLKNHRPQAMWDVAVDPGNTGTVYATSFYDGRATPESGIQVSYDGGQTWTKPATSTPTAALPNCSASRISDPSAFGIGIRPDAPSNVFIGTNCGLAISSDSGLTWSHVNPTSEVPTPANNQVWDVFAQAGGIVDVCGVDGHHRSTDNGATWSGQSTLPGGVCSIVASPLEANTLLVTVAGGLWESRNGGSSWTQIDDNGGGRIPTVHAVADGANDFDLYWGSGVKLRRVDCDDSSTPRCGSDGLADGPGLGSDITGDAHDDTGWVAFDQAGCARYYSNDGGFHRNSGCPGINWDRAMVGMHAMWAWDMDAEPLAGGGTAINFGLQDDGIWHSGDGGASWEGLNCCDGFDNEIDPFDDRAVFSICCSGGTANGTRLEIGDGDDAESNRSVMNTPNGQVPNFLFQDGIANFGPQSYAMVTLDCAMGANGCTGNGIGGAWVTTDEGANWSRLGPAQSPSNPCGIVASVSLGTPVFYAQSGDCNAQRGGGIGRIWRYSGTASGGTWTAADVGLTDVLVFAVHPTQPNRLLAADQAGPTRMVMSEDFGQTWTPLPALDAMMTRGTLFPMDNTRGPTNFTGVGGYAQPSLVAFHPENDDILLAGGRDSGLFLSSDRGQSWALVSEEVSRPWNAAFDTTIDAIYVSTQGRGVYRANLPEVDLGIYKFDNPDPVNAGQQLYYTIIVENFGPSDATNVTVVDDLPPEVDFVTDDLDICDEVSPGQVVCAMGDIAVDDNATVVIKVKVHEDVVVNAGSPTSIQNVASVSAPGLLDVDESNDTVVIGTIVEDLADLTVVKLCEPGRTVPAGTEALCTVIVDNFGPSDARNVVVMDALASDGTFTFSTPTASQGSGCSTSGNTWGCNLGTLPAATLTTPGRATIEVTVTADERVDISDLTRVVSSTPDPDITNNQSSDTILVEAVADLTLTKGDSPDPVVAGEQLTYTLSLQNTGPSTAENVVVVDALPAGVSIVNVAGTGGATCVAGVPGDPFQPTRCSFGTLSPGAMRTMTIVVDVDPDTLGLIVNDASVTSDTLDDDTSDNLQSEGTVVEAEADLWIAKNDIQDPVVAGEILDYELTITNTGPSDARNLVVTDALPAEVTFMSATVLDGSGTCILQDPDANVVECHIGQMPPNVGTPVFIAIKGKVSASTPDGTITNSASVAATETPDPAPGNNATMEDTDVITVADLAIDKTSNQDTYKPSSQVIYTITVTNLGSSDAQSVQVTDTLPTANHDYLFDTQMCTGGEGGVATCDIGTIAAGTSASFNIHIKIKGNPGVISNTADVTSTTTDPDLLNNTDTLENLIKGGTQESGGGGPGPNALSPITATVECSRDNPKGMDMTFSWLDEGGVTRQRSKWLEVSVRPDDFKMPQTRSMSVPGQTNTLKVNERLEPGTVYHWRVGWGGNFSGTATFETPFCPVYDEEE